MARRPDPKLQTLSRDRVRRQQVLRGVSLRRFAVSDFVFCFRLPRQTLGILEFPRCLATIGHHGGGPSEDFLDIVEQFRLRLQLRLEATREVRNTVGSGKAEPLGELAQSRLRVAAAQPGCDRPRHVRIVTLCK